tara:strand:- start:1184 stop:2065 length:882 start_codon:yes stop_codon:yes gene_type:complete
MKGLIWNALFAVSLYSVFSLSYEFTKNFKTTFKIGLAAYVFCVLWVLGLSDVFIGIKIRTGSSLFYFQILNVTAVFIFACFRYKNLTLNLDTISQQESVINLQRGELNKLKDKLSSINDDTLNKYISSIRTNEIRVLVDSKEHNSFLINSIKNAKIDVFVRSGWANDYVINHDFISLIKRKLKEGINFYFGYGYQSSNQNNSQQSHSEMAGEYELSQMKDWSIQNNTKGKIIVKYFPNHSKLLIVDFNFTVCGSFNWLSNGGATLNLEESWVLSNIKFIKERKSILVNSFLDN